MFAADNTVCSTDVVMMLSYSYSLPCRSGRPGERGDMVNSRDHEMVTGFGSQIVAGARLLGTPVCRLSLMASSRVRPINVHNPHRFGLLTTVEPIRDAWPFLLHSCLIDRLGLANFTPDRNEPPNGLPISSRGNAPRQLEPAKWFLELSILECISHQ